MGWAGAFGVATLLAVVAGPPDGTGGDSGGAPETHVALPEFAIEDINGGTLSPASWRGKVVVVNFWATWCAPCVVEVPQLIELQRAHPDTLQIVGLSLDESLEEVRGFAESAGINYPVALVEPGFDAHFGGVVGVPTSFVLDPDGHVVARHVGLVSMSVYEDALRRFSGSAGAGEAGGGHGHSNQAQR
jgi:thiol-disulfide isomerase/thioredoxin